MKFKDFKNKKDSRQTAEKESTEGRKKAKLKPQSKEKYRQKSYEIDDENE
jgi:hypothetical protein